MLTNIKLKHSAMGAFLCIERRDSMTITKPDCVTEKEAQEYVDYVEKKHGRKLKHLEITLDGDEVDLTFDFVPQNFERIRRITGYLVGGMDKWNDAKSAEERDRVKHMSVQETEMESL